jgi:acylphosphatase
MAKVCKRVTYSGSVQGVGFRYTTRRLAHGFPVAGFVRNLPDGDVEIVAEGEASDVEAFLAAVARRMQGYIAKAEVCDQACEGLTAFEIRH